MGKYYAIKSDDKKLIVNTWDEAKLIIKDLKSPKYKSFSTIEEAEAFLSGIEIVNDENISGVVAYIDGGYTLKTYRNKNGKVWLEPANSNYPNLYPTEQLVIFGVAQGIVRKL